jgi:membrane protein YqaA with SNARE-associated domain
MFPPVATEIVIAAAALFVVSRTAVAVSVTVAGVGTVLGAV